VLRQRLQIRQRDLARIRNHAGERNLIRVRIERLRPRNVLADKKRIHRHHPGSVILARRFQVVRPVVVQDHGPFARNGGSAGGLRIGGGGRRGAGGEKSREYLAAVGVHAAIIIPPHSTPQKTPCARSCHCRHVLSREPVNTNEITKDSLRRRVKSCHFLKGKQEALWTRTFIMKDRSLRRIANGGPSAASKSSRRSATKCSTASASPKPASAARSTSRAAASGSPPRPCSPPACPSSFP